jgi:hypothetical protein
MDNRVSSKPGFGSFNLRALAIVLTVIFSLLFALIEPTAVSAATGILETILGYTFGVRTSDTNG